MGEAIAKARADISEATGIISETKIELLRLNSEFETHSAACKETIDAAKSQIAILEADYAIGERIQNMTKCDAAAVQDAQSVSLMQCRKGSKGRASFQFGGKASLLSKGFRSHAANF